MLDTSSSSIRLMSIGCLSLNSPISVSSKIDGLTKFSFARVNNNSIFS